jgi:hypothetical protein
MSKKQISITYTALIWLGMGLCVAGAVAAILGAGGSTSFELEFGDFKAKTAQVGLSIMVIGAALAGLIAVKLPAGVKVMAVDEAPYTMTEKLARKLPAAMLAVAILGFVSLSVYSLFYR